MIAWCGSIHDGLAWLHDRMLSVDVVSRVTADDAQIDPAILDEVCALHPRRLVLAVDSRLEYPLESIRHLASQWPEIPWALATSSWHDGARRTGVGSTPHLSLPWYRWWDGWFQWLSHGDAQLLGNWPRITTALLYNAKTQPPISTSGVIVSSNYETATGWKECLLATHCGANMAFSSAKAAEGSSPFEVQNKTLGRSPVLLSKNQFSNWLAAPTHQPDWFLWDDTSLNTFQVSDGANELNEFFRGLKAQFPSALLVAATGMPRWSQWQQWMFAGVDELIVKPSAGLPLIAALGNRLSSVTKQA